MLKYKASNLELELNNPHEILGMGGPHICDVWFNNKLIIEECISHNFVYDEKRDLLFYVQYHRINYYQGFTIDFYHLTLGATCQFTREFDMVYIKEFINDRELEIYRSFHDGFPEKRMIFNLDEEEMVTIE